MIKKKLSILLSLLLAVLFINLLDTTSYAYNYRITDADCDTLIDRVVTSSYDWKSTAKTRLKTMVNNVYNNGWDTCVISLNNQNYFDIAVYGFNASTVTSVKDSKNVNYMGVNTSNTTNIRYYCSKSGSSMSSISSSTWQNYSTFGSGAQKRSAYLVVPNDLGATGELFSGPWQSNDYLVFSPPDYFTFLLSPSIPTLTINGDSVPYFNLNSNTANDFYLGVLGLAENYYDSELFEYRYYQGKWKLNKITKIQDIGEVEQNLISVTIKGKYLASNTLYSLQMNPDPDSDFAPYSQPFFMKDRNTVITNGELNTEDTFSGDYYNNYNNDTNTENIIDSITNGNPEAELSPIETMLSGDAQDVANNFGFWSAIGPNLFPSNIYNRIYDRMTMVTDVLYESGDVYFDFSMHGETPTRIHSSDIYLPNGALKTFISTFLIAGTCWLVWKQFYGYYELITTGNFILLFHDIDIDKTIFKM